MKTIWIKCSLKYTVQKIKAKKCLTKKKKCVLDLTKPRKFEESFAIDDEL